MFLFVQNAHALTIKDVRFGVHTDKTRMVVDLDKVSDYRVFTLSDPWRIVIDLPYFSWNVGSISRPPNSIVSDIRKGSLTNDVSRIVIDLSGPSRIKTVFFLPAASGKNDRLVVDLVPTSVSDALSQKGRVFGRLTTDDPSSSTQHKSAVAPSPAVQAQPESSARPVSRPTSNATVPEQQISSAYKVDNSAVLPDRKPSKAVYTKPLIIIDAGHGGADPGAVSSNGIMEKHVTLSMAKTLKSYLEETGRYNVQLTRDRDKYMRLYQRVDVARNAKADLFISLHADSIDKSSVRGASIYTLSEKASDKQTARLAMRENRADLIAGVNLSEEDEVVVNILVDLAMRDTMNQSKFLANTVVDGLQGQNIKILQNPHRYAGFAVLKAPDVPSILIEMGFMSNASEARQLSDVSFQKKLSKALVTSIDSYFEKIKRDNRT